MIRLYGFDFDVQCDICCKEFCVAYSHKPYDYLWQLSDSGWLVIIGGSKYEQWDILCDKCKGEYKKWLKMQRRDYSQKSDAEKIEYLKRNS